MTTSRKDPNLLHPDNRRSRAGFTAIEISAVATIIAILALILIPILSNQVEEAKMVAAQDDMASIEKAEMAAYSYVNRYVRPQDLNALQANIQAGMTADQINIEYRKLPPAVWNRAADSGTVANFRSNWKGPYLAIHRGKSVRELCNANPVLFWSPDGNVGDLATPQGGPILLLAADENDWVAEAGQDVNGEDGLDRSIYPVDPWGNPYIFFGPETGFNGRTNCIIYSLGPDGLPGNFGANISVNYYPQAGLIGTGDDLKREF